MVLTDLPEIIPNLDHNFQTNSAVLKQHGGSCEVSILDWTDPSALCLTSEAPPTTPTIPAHKFPLILAADPIYSSEHPRLLVDAISQHLSRDMAVARVGIELPLREAYAPERRDLRDRMSAQGLVILDEGEEVGYDDWASGGGNELTEVRCRFAVWGWNTEK